MLCAQDEDAMEDFLQRGQVASLGCAASHVRHVAILQSVINEAVALRSKLLTGANMSDPTEVAGERNSVGEFRRVSQFRWFKRL